MSDEKTDLERVPSPNELTLQPAYPRPADSKFAKDYGYGYGNQEEEEGLNVRRLWQTTRKHKWLIAIVTFIITSIVTIEMFRTPSLYESSTVIEVGKEDPGAAKPGSFIFQVEDPIEMNLKTKMQAIKSPAVLEAVVIKLGLDQNPKFFSVGAKKSILDAVKLFGDRVMGNGDKESAKDVDEANATTGPPPATRSAEERARLEPYMDAINGGLMVVPIQGTRDLKITYSHGDKNIVAAVANAVAEVFIQYSFESKTEKFTRASDWLDRSTRELKAKAQEAEQALANYTRENNIFSTEGKETLTTDKLSRLHEQVMRAETDRMLKQSLFEEAKQGRVAQLPEAFADPKTTDLQKQLQELKVSEADLDLKFGPDNPQVAQIKQKIAVIQEQINLSRGTLAERLKADYERAIRDEQSLKTAFERAKAEAVNQNQAAIQLNILKQDVDTANKLYTEFLQNTSQANLEVAQQRNNLRVISAARVPKAPVAPRRTRTIFFGFMIGVAAGIGLAMFLEYVDNTIKTVDDVSRYVRLPALGVIPNIGAPQPRTLSAKGKTRRKALVEASNGNGANPLRPAHLMTLDSRSSAAEAYRVIRTSVLLSSAGHAPKTMLITSAQPGEGKTTTVVNTAISLAQLGASVLLIDCDLRRPSTHKLFGVDNLRGLSTYLSRDIKIDGLIQKLQMPNLSLLPCGPLPPNPAELISSEKMRQLLADLSEQYDHILIDSPPLINVTDPVILSRLVDGVIMVIHGGKSSRDVVRRARQELEAVGAKIFGVVLNNVDLRREGYNYYYYRYYSGYHEQNETGVGPGAPHG
jgi:succinoglycan biosynthesis transport protein ExoP